MIRFNVFLLATLVVLSVVSNNAKANASALAFGGDNSWGWATRSNQKEANSVALKFCNQNALKKDCKLTFVSIILNAENDTNQSWVKTSSSVADARKMAIKACGHATCKVTFETTKPGFFSLAKSAKDKNGGAHYYLAHEFSNLDEAIKESLRGCEKNGDGEKCDTFWSGVIPGNYGVSPPPISPQIKAEKSCRPNTPTVQCSSQCENGNCLVTYKNGCKIRVQVQPNFDSFNNQWTFPPPSC
jgi:hypothetical protein